MTARSTSGALGAGLIAPARDIARALARQAPDQDLLSGIHNPFGHHAGAAQAWSFLDIAEDTHLLDRVAELIGPDIILWDSELYFDLSALAPDEGQCWPVEPLAGVIAVISLESREFALTDIAGLPEASASLTGRRGAQFVVRYMPATSHFNREPLFPPNRRAAEARPLVNYANRPIWLVRGKDGGNNDFATGFMVPAARWTGGGLNETSHMNEREKRHGA